MTSLRRHRNQRGASLLETAIVLPLLLMLGIGLAEIGFLVIDYLTISNAAREGARVGAAAGDYVDSGTGQTADDLIKEVVEQVACNLEFSELVSLEIFKADGDGNPVDPTNALNLYQPLGPLACESAATSLACVGACPWDPASRNRVFPNLDNLGVRVTFRHEPVVGLLPFPSVTWTEQAVMRLEPDTRG